MYVRVFKIGVGSCLNKRVVRDVQKGLSQCFAETFGPLCFMLDRILSESSETLSSLSELNNDDADLPPVMDSTQKTLLTLSIHHAC